jgi:hypothetical protein
MREYDKANAMDELEVRWRKRKRNRLLLLVRVNVNDCDIELSVPKVPLVFKRASAGRPIASSGTLA